MPLPKELEKASIYGGWWAGIKTANNLLSLGALVISITLDNQEKEEDRLIKAQAALTYLSLLGDAVLGLYHSKKLLDERIKKLDANGRKTVGNKCCYYWTDNISRMCCNNKCLPDIILPIVGLVLGTATESIGLSVGASDSTARKILRTIAAPLSTVFFSAHTDAIDKEMAKLDQIGDGTIQLTAPPVVPPTHAKSPLGGTKATATGERVVKENHEIKIEVEETNPATPRCCPR